jgi:hypothetical protein
MIMGVFRYSEECLFRTSQEERDWQSKLSNHSSNSKRMGNTTTRLGKWLMLKEH